MGINKVLLCGLGAVGLTYADKLKDVCELKILADIERIKKYKNYPPIFNNNNFHKSSRIEFRNKMHKKLC